MMLVAAGADRADGVLDAPARPHVQARPRSRHAEQCRRPRTGGASSSSSRSRSAARARRRSCSSTASARSTRALWSFLAVLALGIARRVRYVLGAAAGRPVPSWRDVLPRQRDPAAAARRRAARLRRRQADRARRAAAARRSDCGTRRRCSTIRAASAASSPRSPAIARARRCCRCSCSPRTGSTVVALAAPRRRAKA